LYFILFIFVYETITWRMHKIYYNFSLLAITNERCFDVDKILTYTMLFSNPERVWKNVRNKKRKD
jgi:hypothetical protein